MRTKVFLVDDQAIFREGLSLLINRELDLEVCAQTDSGRFLIQDISKVGPDIVVVHISLSGKLGFELIEEIRLQHPTVPVLAMSQYEKMMYVERAISAGAKGYVVTQESASEIIRAIRQITKGRTYVSERLSNQLLERFIDVFSALGKNGVGQLSNRELRVLQLLGEGKTVREMADQLCLSAKTIETYRSRMRRKLNCRTCSELRQYAIEWSKSTDSNN